MNKIKKFITKHKILLLLILLALLLRFPWLYTTIEKDEGVFGYTAWRMLSGDKLYTDIKENKPPLLYILYAIPIYFFGNSIIPVRIFNNIFFIVSIVFFFNLIKQLFTKKDAIFSTLFYAIFMNIPVFEGYLAMSESLLMPFLIISIYSFKKYISLKKIYFLFISSIFACLTILIKQQAIFIYFLLIGGLFIYKEKNKIKNIFFIFFPLILLILGIFFVAKGLFLNFLQRIVVTLTQSSMGFSSGYNPLEYNLLIILEGSILWLFSSIGIIKVFKSKLNKENLFIIFWFFSALAFTIIPPAYGHYYIFLIPPLAVFAGMGAVYVLKSKQNKKTFLFLVTILIILTGGLVIKHYPDSTLNSSGLHWGWSSLENYQQQILLSEYIKNVTQPGDTILIWGWEPGIHWLSERDSPIKGEPIDIICDMSDLKREQIKKEVYLFKDLKAIISLPYYSRKCGNRTKKILSDLLLDYNKIEFKGIEVYVKQ